MRIWKVTEPGRAEAVIKLVEKIAEGSVNNRDLWSRLAPFTFKQYYGTEGFNLCGTISGLVPEDENQDLPKGWIFSKDRGVIPNGRTKEGKEILRKLDSETVQVYFGEVYKAIRLAKTEFSRFGIPQVRVSKDGKEAYVMLDEKYDLEGNQNFEEVTISYVNSKLK